MKKIIAALAFLMLLAPSFGLAQSTSEIDAFFENDQERILELERRLQELEDGLEGIDIPNVETLEFEGRVSRIISRTEVEGAPQMIFDVAVGDEEYRIDTSLGFTEGLRYRIREGDKVMIQVVKSDGEIMHVFLIDVVRRGSLVVLGFLFAAVVLAIGWWRGLFSLVGLAITFLVLFNFVFPRILAGSDAMLITIIGSLIILAVNMHLSHGFKKRTALAFASTAVGLMLVFIFAKLFSAFADLTGLTSETSILLYFQHGDVIVPQGILLAGIILGAVGVLDDIAVTQTETVQELAEANPKLSRSELFRRAMRVGRHHIASTVNTLVLAYAGVAFPLILLFLATQGVDAARFINEEPVAEEIVRTLAGTMALVLVVPISTWFATAAQKR